MIAKNRTDTCDNEGAQDAASQTSSTLYPVNTSKSNQMLSESKSQSLVPRRSARVAKQSAEKSSTKTQPQKSAKQVNIKHTQLISTEKANTGNTEAAKLPVGTRLLVFWPLEKDYHPCVIKEHMSNGNVKLLYDDGDKDTLDLEKEEWKLDKGNKISKLPK
jgi:hypothetical protein